jgi:hypothetical protein
MTQQLLEAVAVPVNLQDLWWAFHEKEPGTTPNMIFSVTLELHNAMYILTITVNFDQVKISLEFHNVQTINVTFVGKKGKCVVNAYRIA